jgi:hypothetical protein
LKNPLQLSASSPANKKPQEAQSSIFLPAKKKIRGSFLPFNSWGLDQECPEEELLMMKTMNVAQNREGNLLMSVKNASLCQDEVAWKFKAKTPVDQKKTVGTVGTPTPCEFWIVALIKLYIFIVLV